MHERTLWPFHWEIQLCKQLYRSWPSTPTLNAVMVVVAQWTPMSMLALIVLSSTGFGLPFLPVRTLVVHAIAAVVSAVAARAFNEPISVWFNRPRPFEVSFASPLLPHESGKSFPSNHATGAFALAVAMTGVPGYSPVLILLAVLLATSRIYTGLHYATDVVAGALHGTLVASSILWLTMQFPLTWIS